MNKPRYKTTRQHITSNGKILVLASVDPKEFKLIIDQAKQSRKIYRVVSAGEKEALYLQAEGITPPHLKKMGLNSIFEYYEEMTTVKNSAQMWQALSHDQKKAAFHYVLRDAHLTEKEARAVALLVNLL